MIKKKKLKDLTEQEWLELLEQPIKPFPGFKIYNLSEMKELSKKKNDENNLS
jgi:hypothetical protein